MRKRICIDENWRFRLGDDAGAVEPGFDHSGWRVVGLPHDWSVEATPHPDNPAGPSGGFFPGGVGWYRKELPMPANLGDRHVIIEFDGVYMNSEVFCNGRFCGRRPYGYSSFAYDITPFVKAGETAVIAVRVDNSRQENCRWYSGSGIYRHVWLTTASPIRVGHWGAFVTTPKVSGKTATVVCEVSVVNQSGADTNIEVCATMIGPDGTKVATAVKQHKLAHTSAFPGGGEHQPAEVPSRWNRGSQGTVNLELAITNPRLWSPDTPDLYTVRVELKQGGSVVDCHDTRCGIRSIRFDANEGFFLNGKNLKFRGVNEHHDAGCLGAAVPDDVMRRRFRILKEMGCNAIRVAHNPASPTFLDLCDEMGFMVVEDAFDEWKDGKTPFGYHLYWDQWWERDLADMILRDRNHSSIVLWSVGNEIKEVREGRPEGLPIMAALRETCHRVDPTRPMTCGCCAIRKTNAGGYGPLMDVVGYNGGGGSCFLYEKDHATYPDRVIVATEVPHSLQTRGVYRTRTWYRDLRAGSDVCWYPLAADAKPVESPGLELMRVPHLAEEEVFTDFDNHYLSSYDNAMVRISASDSWRRTSTLPFMCGEFRWTGFDYLGECYSWPAKSWNFGIIDLCGFPKDTYYFYQSQWTTKPMVHILPHWTWPGLEGKIIPVVAYANCDAVELFLDGESLGVKEMGEAMRLQWNVVYRPGILKAVGIAGGKPVAECRDETAGEAAAIKLSADKETIRADGTGIAHVTVTIVDAQGRFVPRANPELTFAVAGAGALIGLENGDPIDTTNYKLNSRKAFNGMALAVVQAAKVSGPISVTVTAEGLASATIRLVVATSGS